jgi:Domain of unknown function (DUF4340)
MNRWIRWTLPVLLLGVAIVLGAWWRSGASTMFREPLARLSPDRVDTITLVGGRGTLRYERRGDAWRQVEPYDHPSDPAAIRLLLAAAADVAPAYRVPLAEVPDAARLATPDLAVDLGSTGASIARLRVGADHPAGLAWLAEDNAAAAGPCPPEFKRLAMAAAAGALRDDRLFESAGADSDRIRLSVPGPQASEMLLERTRGGWRMLAPYAARADEQAVSAFLQAAARLRHAGLVQADAGDGAAHGLDRPSAEIAIRTNVASGGAPREECLQLGAESGAGALFARQVGRPPVVSVEARQLAGVLLPPAVFIDPRACGVRADDVVGVRVLDTEDRARLRLERVTGTWMRVSDNDERAAIDDRSLRELLRSLCETRAGAIAGDAPREEWRTGRVELSLSDGTSRSVTLWRLPDGGWAMSDGDGPAKVFASSLPMPIEPTDHAPKR